MTRILLWSVATGLSMLALLSGCRSITPPVVYYTIHPIVGEIAAMDADGAPAVRIGIRSVELPGTVNRTQMVRLSGANRVLISSFNRWADYPDRLVQRVIDQNLSLLLPDAHVVSAPWPVGFQPDVIVSFQFIELIAAADQTMRLDVAWSVRA
ncbi:MAG TPA: PqiC family protein, partial [Desulfosarcina sp.]|nr:PqiC family protein [Desulfosarcina sp.]